MSVRVFAPAKINLTLEVGPPRTDGYHPLQSVVMFADVGDWIEAREADALTLEITGPFASALNNEPDNLVLRAARALGEGRGAALKLEKNLPIASGIGGGSSDAAAALKALKQLWALDSDLTPIARTLGADVSVCMDACTTYMTGTGEIFAPMQAPRMPVVLVNPLKPLATAEVYRAYDTLGVPVFTPHAAPLWASVEEALAGMRGHVNDLFHAASSLMPEIGKIVDVLEGDPRALNVEMSGSGATVFAIMQSRDAAAACAADLRARHPRWWITDAMLGAP